MPTSLRFSGAFVVIIPAIEGAGREMQSAFKRIGLVGRSKQSGLREVVHELLALLAQREVEVVLEDRLGELVDDSSHPLASCDEIGQSVDLEVQLAGLDSCMGDRVELTARLQADGVTADFG